MPVEVLGYSERGIVNALVDDISHEPNSTERLQEFLGWLQFPNQREDAGRFAGIQDATLLVEQSFSDFGDLDLLVLLEHAGGRRQALLIEAKVSKSRGGYLEKGWRGFLQHVAGTKYHTSNLFVQLYRKRQLVRWIAGDQQNPLPADDVSRSYRIGGNNVVLAAKDKLQTYLQNDSASYIALIPDPEEYSEQFFLQTIRECPDARITGLPGWNTDHWGFASWQRIYHDAAANPELWPRLNKCFYWNRSLVFHAAPGAANLVDEPLMAANQGNQAIAPGSQVNFNWQQHVLIRKGIHGTVYIAAIAFHDDYFPRAISVPMQAITPLPLEHALKLSSYRPRIGGLYTWSPVEGSDRLPPGSPPQPPPPINVVVVCYGPNTCRVRQFDGNQPVGPSFLVHTYHLIREPLG